MNFDTLLIDELVLLQILGSMSFFSNFTPLLLSKKFEENCKFDERFRVEIIIVSIEDRDDFRAVELKVASLTRRTLRFNSCSVNLARYFGRGNSFLNDGNSCNFPCRKSPFCKLP